MKINYLYSGSDGNCTYIQTDKVNLFIDAGISYKRVISALSVQDVKANIILITHEHADHILSLGVLGRKTHATIFIPEKCYEKIKNKLKGCKIIFIKGGHSFKYKDLLIKVFSTRHDSLESVGYSLTDLKTNKVYTHITDTGVLTYMILKFASIADGLFIESDYDTYLLDTYKEYDDYLKMRINSNTGHLSNQQIISFLKNEKYIFKWVVLGHLSKKTNSKETIKNLINTKLNKEIAKKVFIFNNELINKEIL